VQDGEQLLEVGTGTGLAFQYLVAANPNGWTVGIDLTPAMIRRARTRMAGRPQTRYHLHEAQATALPYPPNTFDAVFSGYLIDVLPSSHIRPALREMRRVLHPEGRLVLVYWAPPRRRIERLWGMLAHVVPPLFGGARPVHIRAPLRAAGFHVEARTSCLQGGLRSAVVRARPA
jgi:ubiquinone/menaquinone biosynthesis C-methylase UbiE